MIQNGWLATFPGKGVLSFWPRPNVGKRSWFCRRLCGSRKWLLSVLGVLADSQRFATVDEFLRS